MVLYLGCSQITVRSLHANFAPKLDFSTQTWQRKRGDADDDNNRQHNTVMTFDFRGLSINIKESNSSHPRCTWKRRSHDVTGRIMISNDGDTHTRHTRCAYPPRSARRLGDAPVGAHNAHRMTMAPMAPVIRPLPLKAPHFHTVRGRAQ